MNNKEIFNYCKKIISDCSDIKLLNENEQQVGYGVMLGYYNCIVDEEDSVIRLEYNDQDDCEFDYSIEFNENDDVERLKLLKEILHKELNIKGYD